MQKSTILEKSDVHTLMNYIDDVLDLPTLEIMSMAIYVLFSAHNYSNFDKSIVYEHLEKRRKELNEYIYGEIYIDD